MVPFFTESQLISSKQSFRVHYGTLLLVLPHTHTILGWLLLHLSRLRFKNSIKIVLSLLSITDMFLRQTYSRIFHTLISFFVMRFPLYPHCWLIYVHKALRHCWSAINKMLFKTSSISICWFLAVFVNWLSNMFAQDDKLCCHVDLRWPCRSLPNNFAIHNTECCQVFAEPFMKTPDF